jgi:hypothetical protein
MRLLVPIVPSFLCCYYNEQSGKKRAAYTSKWKRTESSNLRSAESLPH